MSATGHHLAPVDDTRPVDRTVEAPAERAGPGLVTARGTTTIAPGVVAAIARRAAGEVHGVEAVDATGLQGVLATLRSSSSGGASADVAARRAAIDLRLAVRWPLPVHDVTMAVRDHVQQRVQELTGHVVTDVDITVTDLPGVTRRPAPRVR